MRGKWGATVTGRPAFRSTAHRKEVPYQTPPLHGDVAPGPVTYTPIML